MLDGVKLTMSKPDLERLQSIKTLPSLLAYLKHDLDWPIEADEIEDIFFEYDPEELGLAPGQAAGIKEIKQLRPMDSKQPWGIFWVNFEKKRLPVVMLRRVLGHLVIKKRASANKAAQRAWHANDLLFISAYGEEHDRAITFAHFAQDADSTSDLPVLKVLGWDGGDTVLHLADAHRTLTEKLRWPTNPENLAVWRDQWAEVFTVRHREVITTTTELVEELAKLATSIRKRADTILSRESDRGPMRQLYGAFKTTLIHDLSEDDFADVIAQTISYGLLAARFSNKGSISIKSLVDMIPPTNPFLRELLGELLAVAGRKKGTFDFDELGIQDVVDLLNQANAEAVKSDFGNRTRNEDPVIHFYEHFLKAYDKKKKVQRGVFFTPQPVVSYIVRSVHELLQTEYGLVDGLADTTTWDEMVKRIKGLMIPDGAKPGDPFVLILDPATGTATFLVEVIEIIFTHLKKKWTDLGKKPAEISRLWNEYVPRNLLPRLYGYELMMAPYTIAHMKLALKLQEINARLGQFDLEFATDERAHIYLTNSLEPAGDDKQGVLEGIFPALTHEAAAVNRVKKGKRFTVVIGNPPYSGFSSNRNDWIEALLKGDVHWGKANYYEVAGKSIAEKKIWLQDDYVKFMRLSHLLLEQTTIGIHGMITNHSYLDSPTCRGMRFQMLQFFNRLFFIDLHGSTKRAEEPPGGIADENVFDILPGVTIAICGRSCAAGIEDVRSFDLWGTRAYKSDWLSRNGISKVDWIKPNPCPPYYLFAKRQLEFDKEYLAFYSLKEIFPFYATGIQTSRDDFATDFDRFSLEDRLRIFFDLRRTDGQISETFGLSDTRGWKIKEVRRSSSFESVQCAITQCVFRPFDRKWIALTKDVVDWPRLEVMSCVSRNSLGLLCSRQQSTAGFRHAMVVDGPADMFCISNKSREGQTVFPLYSKQDDDLFHTRQDSPRNPNFGNAFTNDLAKLFHNGRPQNVEQGLTDKEINCTFQYIYAILYSQAYRTRYSDLLKIDFPRLPLTSSLDLFRALAKLGGELVALHLMESPKLDKRITEWIGGPNSHVEKVTYSNETVWTNKAQSEGFRGIPENVWNFHIGGYQVCEKWLKDRKGRPLSEDDISHYQKIVVALSETIRLMQEIDQVIEEHGGWPGAFQMTMIE